MPSGELRVHLYARPEAWGERDHVEWTERLVQEGFVRDGARWRGPPRADGTAMRVRVDAAPESGEFVLAVPEADFALRPEATARALATLVRRVAERADVEYGAGFVRDAPARVRAASDLRALHALNVFGPDLVQGLTAARVDRLPGFHVHPLSGAAALVHVPLDGFTGEWTNNEEARFLEAEMHLGLTLDPSRYSALAGPAQSFVARRGTHKP